MPIHTLVVDRWHAYTIRVAAELADLWRIPDRLQPAPRTEKRYPRTQTTDTPICRAWRGHPRYLSASICDCVPFCAQGEEAERPDRLAARRPRHGGKTAATTAARRRLAFAPNARHRTSCRRYIGRRTHRPLQCAPGTPHQMPCRMSVEQILPWDFDPSGATVPSRRCPRVYPSDIAPKPWYPFA